MEETTSLYAYTNIADVRRRGCSWMADVLESAGLPLEILLVASGRVITIHAYDYVEGRAHPLIERVWWWFDGCGPPDPAGLSAVLAVYPDGSQHTLAAQ
jgi:hypothetical protein